MKSSKRLVFTLVIIIAAIGLGYSLYMNKNEEIIPPPATDESVEDKVGTICELGKKYERSALKKDGCVCPDGYVFDSNIIGYDQCMGEGSECPILEVECVEES